MDKIITLMTLYTVPLCPTLKIRDTPLSGKIPEYHEPLLYSLIYCLAFLFHPNFIYPVA